MNKKIVIILWVLILIILSGYLGYSVGYASSTIDREDSIMPLVRVNMVNRNVVSTYYSNNDTLFVNIQLLPDMNASNTTLYLIRDHEVYLPMKVTDWVMNGTLCISTPAEYQKYLGETLCKTYEYE